MPTPQETELQELARLYPAWAISKSGIGRWWAIREETRLRQGCRVTLDADELEDLAEMIAEQERMRASWRDRSLIPFRTGDPT